MQVILRKDVEKVGLRGDLVDVAPGYARNFLLPRQLAELATPGRVADLRRREADRARQEARTVEQAREIAGVLEQTELRFDVKAGPTGALFGSVTATDIVDELWRTRRVRVDRRKVGLDEPIKRIGRYEVPIELFTDVTVPVRTLVVPEGGELPPEEELVAESAEPVAESGEPETLGTPTGEGEPAPLEEQPPADAPQVPEDAFDRVVDAAVESEHERGS